MHADTAAATLDQVAAWLRLKIAAANEAIARSAEAMDELDADDVADHAYVRGEARAWKLTLAFVTELREGVR